MSDRTLAEICDEVGTCRKCPRLVKWRESVAEAKRAAFANETYWGRAVPGFGDPCAGLMIVGLAPAAHGANRTGRMFTGDRSGDWLYAALHRAGLASSAVSERLTDGLELTGAYVTSVVKCAPPANKPTPSERDECARYLIDEIETLAPEVFVALGNFAWNGLLSALTKSGWNVPSPKPRFGHLAEASLVRLKQDALLIGSFHPSQQNTFTGKLTIEMFDAVFARAVGVMSNANKQD